jgi:hypothetical protein
MGAKHGAERNRKTWKEDREAEAAELGYSRQPYCVIVGSLGIVVLFHVLKYLAEGVASSLRVDNSSA